MRFSTVSSPHMSPSHSVSRVMRQVIYALVPGTLAMAWFFGWGVLINVMLGVSFAVVLEAIMLMVRRRPVGMFLGDLSAVVTGWLIALAIPPLAPWWITLVAVFFAIVIAKQLYGGLGYNVFNPAMVGYVVVLISFPREMTQWVPPTALADFALDLPQTLGIIMLGQLPADLSWDMVTGATPLDRIQTELGMDRGMTEIQSSPFFGMIAGFGWEWINLIFMAGGIWLLLRGIITWHVPLAMLASMALIATPFWLINPETHAAPWIHLLSGSAMIGAFFIATDPVSGSSTLVGRLIFGAGVGLMVYVIRTWGGYADGVAFAVLLMNMVAPIIDQYTQPRTFGKPRKGMGS